MDYKYIQIISVEIGRLSCFISFKYLYQVKEGKMDINAHLPNVLIVDDEIGPRESLRMILKPNYNVYCAEDGYMALQILKKPKWMSSPWILKCLECPGSKH